MRREGSHLNILHSSRNSRRHGMKCPKDQEFEEEEEQK
jgi:hypothetical protein